MKQKTERHKLKSTSRCASKSGYEWNPDL